MQHAKPSLSLLCVFLLLAPGSAFSQQPSPSPKLSEPHGFISKITRPYTPPDVPLSALGNTDRINALIRAGNLYLSLEDAVALALENNIDIAIQRYGPQIADAGLLSAQAGGNARGVSTTVTAGPNSASVNASGTTPGTNQNAASQASAATSSAVGGSILQTSGPAIPNLDPFLIGGISWAHATTPQSSAFITGTNSLIQRQDLSNLGIQKGFLTGTIVSLGINNNATTSNNPRNDFNPSKTSALSLTFTQHLLQGFGTAVNSRQIHIARNNREVSDLTFKLQVITTVAAVMNLYWDLVAFNENVRVATQAVEAATRLWEDNKRQVEVGTLAPIEVTRAEAQIALGNQQLTIATMQVLQQETIIKNALSRNGLADPTIQSAHIIPTDQIRVPDVEPISPLQDLTSLAISSRPELAQSRIQIQNQQITMRGSKNGLLPTLDIVASTSNSGLAGDPSTLTAPAGTVHSNNPFFMGGYGDVLQQLLARNFPNYSVGFNLSVPIRNRAAQAQVINDELALRQQQLGLQRLENGVRVDVQNALIGLNQARAQIQTASRQRVLQEQTLDAEQKKLALGASNIYNVIQDTQTLTAAQASEVAARAAYAKARVEMERSTGQILTNHKISVDEAYKGQVTRPPDPIPLTPPQAPVPAPAPASAKP